MGRDLERFTLGTVRNAFAKWNMTWVYTIEQRTDEGADWVTEAIYDWDGVTIRKGFTRHPTPKSWCWA
jgi:hypothetical protein